MKVLVIYESMYGNTHRIAAAIGTGLRDAHVPVAVLSVREARARGARAGDVIVVGAPTHRHGLSREASRESAVADARTHGALTDSSAREPGVREWLTTLDPSTRVAAAFDTRIKGPAALTGRASHTIAEVLHGHGLELMIEPRSFLVTFSDELVPGEEERAHRWGAELASHLATGIS
jgi:hypothetical protein